MTPVVFFYVISPVLKLRCLGSVYQEDLQLPWLGSALLLKFLRIWDLPCLLLCRKLPLCSVGLDIVCQHFLGSCSGKQIRECRTCDHPRVLERADPEVKVFARRCNVIGT